MPRRVRDAAISDIAGTLLLVAGVVLAGSLLTVVVAANLSVEPVPSVSVALAGVSPQDTSVRLLLKAGDSLPLNSFTLQMQRNESAFADVPRASWVTPDNRTLRPGDRLTFPLSPPAAEGERLRFQLISTGSNAVIARLAERTGSETSSMGVATLVANLTPDAMVADGVSAARLTVRVSHPAGAGAIARVTADLSQLSVASRTANATLALGDAGAEGDASGADGIWSGLVRAPALTSPGVYNITVNATDLAGRLAGSAVVRLNITGNVSFAIGTGGGTGNGTGGGAGGTGGGSGGTVVNGTCYGCVVSGGHSSYEGTRLSVPTAENLTTFRLQNWTWDRLNPTKLKDDAVVIRVVNTTHAWSMYFRFTYTGTTACITYARAWSSTNDTTYAPVNGTCLPLERLDLNLVDPVASGQLVRTSGNAHPQALYKASGINDRPTFILAYMRNEDPTGQSEQATEIGIFSMDVVMS